MKTPKKLWIDYKKPTPEKWRKRGDYALLMLATIQVAIAGAPIEVLSIRQSYWLSLILTLVGTTYKFWTNTHTEDENNTI